MELLSTQTNMKLRKFLLNNFSVICTLIFKLTIIFLCINPLNKEFSIEYIA